MKLISKFLNKVVDVLTNVKTMLLVGTAMAANLAISVPTLAPATAVACTVATVTVIAGYSILVLCKYQSKERQAEAFSVVLPLFIVGGMSAATMLASLFVVIPMVAVIGIIAMSVIAAMLFDSYVVFGVTYEQTNQ